MKQSGEIQANNFTNTTIILIIILTLFVGTGSALTNTTHATANPTMTTGTIDSGSYSNTLTSDNLWMMILEPEASDVFNSDWASWQTMNQQGYITGIQISLESNWDTPENEAVYFQTWNYTSGAYNTTWVLLGIPGRPADNIINYTISDPRLINQTISSSGAFRIRLADARTAINSADAVKSKLSIDEFKTVITYTSLNITSYSNNFTRNNSLSLTVPQNAVVNFNLTSNNIINSNTTSLSSGVTSLSNSSLGSTSFWANFSFPNIGRQYINLSVTNSSRMPSRDYRNWTITVIPVPINITSNGNNVTNNNNLAVSVNQGSSIRFNITANITINSNTSSIPSGVSTIGNDTIGKTTFWADFSFSDYGTKYVNLTVTNSTCQCTDYRNWTVTVNDVTPPNQVTNLTNRTSPTHNSINLGWDNLTDNTGGSGLKDYFVQKTNNSINWATITPTINATKIRSGDSTTNWTTGKYSDAYYYTFRNTVPVDCILCHTTLGPKQSSIGNLWTKFDSTNIYFFVHAQDNDTSNNDDELEFVFDPDKNGGDKPQTDDRKYVLHEDNTTEWFKGNGIGWILDTSSTASYSVQGAGGKGPRYEIAIPLSDIGNPANDSTVKFAFEVQCNNGSDFIQRINYLPEGASDENPNSGWMLLTYRNSTVWDIVANPITNYSDITGLMPNFRYNFSVFARDNALNNGTRSSSYIGQTNDRIGYNISGYITSISSPINNANIRTGEYIVLSNATGYYILNDLINDTYNLTVTASGFESNSLTSITLNGSDKSNINITLQDITPPSVSSNSNSVYYVNKSLLILNASITDTGSGVKNATVNVSSLNSTIYEAVLTPQGDYWINTSIIADRGNSGGFVNLTITAYDNASNINNSINMTIGIDNTPPLVISNTNNLYTPNGSALTLNASITDAFPGVKNATVNVSAINSSINEAILTYSEGYWLNSTIIVDKGESIGFINLTITAYDNLSNSNSSVNMTVKIEPDLTIINWSNNITKDKSLNFTVFINDTVRFNVTSNHTASYNWTYDNIDQLIDFDNFSKIFLEIGLHYVNSTISNLIDNDHKNWTINVIYKPDLVMKQENISFSYAPSEVENGEVKENENVTINVTVYNGGLGDATNINIGFYDGSPGIGNNIANATISNISAGSSQNATIYWNSIIGTHNISIKVDPENNLVETDDSNNNASKTINVSAWQKYYGNLSGNLSLRDSIGNSLTNWNWATLQGNIFISNISSFDFNNLQALGRKKNGNVSRNNFGRADEILKMIPGSVNSTGFFNNNITTLFSSNGTTPRNYMNFTVYGRKIENVAIFNSTNTTNFNSVETSPFITGILWDTSKDDGDGDYGDDGEDIVFISGINVKKTGLGNSSHDYEIAIPSIIRSEGNVYFFVELK